MTGEDLAALARRYSRAGPIVSVNRFGEQSFDLRLRRGMDTWAEISVAHEDLRNPRLWIAAGPDSYRPWGWPSLQQLPELFERRVRHALKHLDTPVAEVFAISKTQVELMPRTVSEALGGDPTSLTFKDVALAQAFPSSNVPQPSRPQMARVAAAEVGKWLANSVLPGEEILIDAPHLVVQYPSLLQGARDRDSLNELAAVGADAAPRFDTSKIRSARFRPRFWLDRPAWWTESILENRTLTENLTPWNMRPLKYGFGEDTSKFHPLDKLRAFQAVGIFGERYVRVPDESVRYKPVNRLLG